MFNIERWQEIFDTIRKNKLRTFLTGLSVASGIFILVILLGFGQGMQNGIAQEFEQDATNRIAVWTGVTTVEHKGLNPGRFIELENEEFELSNIFLGLKDVVIMNRLQTIINNQMSLECNCGHSNSVMAVCRNWDVFNALDCDQPVP